MISEVVNAKELFRLLPHLTPAEQAELDELLTADAPIWVPQYGPQEMARQSRADIVFYGGQAGGGKTDLLIGLSLTEQEKSIIYRREAVQLVGIEERITTILGTRKGYNSQDGIWHLPLPGMKRSLELGSVKDPGDWIKYQGRPHDFIGFDEICHFLELQVRALIGWKRTDNPKVRQRVIFAGNPPTDSDGEWVIRFFAPWLDPLHPNPAKPGELRWFVVDEEGKDMEVAGPRAVKVGKDWIEPHSRTFIPSSVDDNLFLSTTGYKSTLMSLPEPLRSQMARGDFAVGRTDHVWQTIPTAWIKMAQARWTPRDQNTRPPMTALGYDVARGGLDRSAACRRHDWWFDQIVTVPGSVTHDGPTGAGFIIPLQRNSAPICIDGIGIGTAVLDFLRGNRLNTVNVVGSEKSHGMAAGGKLYFRNRRAEMYWRVREALDPSNPIQLALPPDQELLADLAAVRYKPVAMGAMVGLLMRDKDDIREELGRSPDKGDAFAMTFIDNLPAASVTDDAARFRALRGRR